MRPKLTQLAALLACVVLVGLAATRVRPINAGRQQLNILGHESPLENTPPEYVFYIQAFGAFRGLIADIAFLRAERLKEQGRFYDAMQLHKWICALQPQFPAVWEYAAWNMAWNISVTTFTAEERWNWVYNGVKLLRDQGIPRNPRALNLYKQLAWIFNNKMSEPTDDQHRAYKCNWAWRMHLVLGPPPDPFTAPTTADLADELRATADLSRLEEAGRIAREQTESGLRKLAAESGLELGPRAEPTPGDERVIRPVEATGFELAQLAALRDMRLIADAPHNLAQLYERHPDARRMVAELRSLGIEITDDTLTEDNYWRAEGLAFAFFMPYRELLSPPTTLARVTRRPVEPSAAAERRENLNRILGVQTGDPAGESLVRFLQRKALREVYKLEPTDMLDLVGEFGPMDWRSVDSQGLYWNVRGLIVSGTKASQYGHDKLNTARTLFFSLHNLFVRGRISFEPDPENIARSYISFSADLNFIESMHQAYVKYGPLFDADAGFAPGAGESFRSGHINLLAEGIRLLYLAGLLQLPAKHVRVLPDRPAQPDVRQVARGLRARQLPGRHGVHAQHARRHAAHRRLAAQRLQRAGGRQHDRLRAVGPRRGGLSREVHAGQAPRPRLGRQAAARVHRPANRRLRQLAGAPLALGLLHLAEGAALAKRAALPPPGRLRPAAAAADGRMRLPGLRRGPGLPGAEGHGRVPPAASRALRGGAGTRHADIATRLRRLEVR
jgi:hypothetical protein